MAKIDTILKVAGAGLILVLGVPVALSVKFGDGEPAADELHREFGIATWAIEVRAPAEFTSLRVEALLERAGAGGGPAVLGSQDWLFDDGRKRAEVRIYLQEQSLRVLCEGGRLEARLPFAPVPAGGGGGPALLHDLGGKGREVGAGRFLLVGHPSGDLMVAITTE